MKFKADASIKSLTFPSSILIPPILALYATPKPQKLLFATAATSPAHLVPCLKLIKLIYNSFYLLSLLIVNLGKGSLSLEFKFPLAKGS